MMVETTIVKRVFKPSLSTGGAAVAVASRVGTTLHRTSSVPLADTEQISRISQDIGSCWISLYQAELALQDKLRGTLTA